MLRGDAPKEDVGSHAVFAERGSSALHMTAATALDVISRLPGCAGEASEAVFSILSGYYNGRCSQLIEITGSRTPSNLDMHSNLDTHTTFAKPKIMGSRTRYCGTIGEKLVRTCIGRCCGNENSQKFCEMGKYQDGNAHRCIEKGFFLSVCADEI